MPRDISSIKMVFQKLPPPPVFGAVGVKEFNGVSTNASTDVGTVGVVTNVGIGAGTDIDAVVVETTMIGAVVVVTGMIKAGVVVATGTMTTVVVGAGGGTTTGGAQVERETTLESSVTAPLRASTRPSTFALVVSVTEVNAIIFPLNVEFVPSVAELLTSQNTLHACAPFARTTLLALAVMRVEAA